MSTLKAAKTIWLGCDGKVTNLSLQKLLFLSHMLDLGAGRSGLVDHEFEAWDYGPVEPSLYQRLKAYGSSRVPDILGRDFYKPGEPQFDAVSEVLAELKDAKASKLVAITHWDGGAWSKHYIPGMRRVTIPDADILKEYEKRVAA